MIGDLGGEDWYDPLSEDGLAVGDLASQFLGDVIWDAESGETGWDLFDGEAGGDLSELPGERGDFRPSPDCGADEYWSVCSGEPMLEPNSLGDFGPSGDFGPAGEAGIEFSGEFISEWASLKLSGDMGCLPLGADLWDDRERLSGEGDFGPFDLGDGGERGGDLESFLELSEDELRLLLEPELLLLDVDWASPDASRESSESISANRQ